MRTSGQGCVVVGGGLAGATLVESLRKEGFEGPLTLIGNEAHRPYERPGLSKDYLQGKVPAADLFVHAAGWYGEHEVRTRFGDEVVEIDRRRSTVRLASGEVQGYDRLVLATGARPRTLPLPGADLDGVHLLRRLEDADALRVAMTAGARWVVVGAGWIGLEVAAVARLAGCAVTVLEAGQVPLERVLGPELGQSFAALHRSHGVDLRTGATVRAIRGADGRATGVDTDGGVVPADLVLVAVGVTPDTALASAAGLAVDDGVVVDEHLVTSDPAILAIGDVANAHHPVLGRRVRVEHWDNAIRQGQLAAATILGRPARYDWQPYFYTDQYDLGLEYVGHSQPGDRLVLRGDPASGTFLAFWTRGDRVTAAMNVNVWDINEYLRGLIGRRIATERLQDEGVPVDQL